MNIDDRLRAASKALRESSVAQVDAASRLREIVRRTGQPVAHGHTAVLLDEPQESPRSLAPSLPASRKVSAAAAGCSATAMPSSRWIDGETRSTFHSQPPSGNAVGRLLGSIWRYRWLTAAAVLLGTLLGYGWAARQPTRYEGVARVLLAAPRTSLPDEASQPPDAARYLDDQAQLMRSAAVLERARKLSGTRITAETLRQRLQVDVAPDANLLTVRVVDATATGAARLADAVTVAYEQVLAQQSLGTLRNPVRQLQSTRSRLKADLAELDAELVGRPDDSVLRAQREATAAQLSAVQRKLRMAEPAAERTHPPLLRERAAVPKQPISPSPGRAMAIGMLVGLLASAVLAWWRTRRQEPTSRSSAPEQGTEMPPP
jgi:capsular polysaccharide biosynthesis protein